MEPFVVFPDGMHVRLRSRAHGRYLFANDDGTGLSLRGRAHRASLNAMWAVHRRLRQGVAYVLLQSAAYGRYIAVTFHPPSPGLRGCRAILCDYDFAQEQTYMMWHVFRSADDGAAAIVHSFSLRILYVSGCSVTVVGLGHPDNQVDNLLWRLEFVPPRPAPPVLPAPPPHRVGLGALFHRRAELWRVIQYIRAEDLGDFNPFAWSVFVFYGRSVFNLRAELAHRVGVAGITLCVRPGFCGQLTPLVVDLPRSQETMVIVVFTNGSPAAEALRYPDVDHPRRT